MSKKICNIILGLLFFSIPFSAKLPLWNLGSWKNEYNTIYLYGTDILIFLFLLCFLWQKEFNISVFLKNKTLKNKIKPLIFILATFLFFVFLSIFVSPNPALSFYQALKITEFTAIFLALIFYRENVFAGNFLAFAFVASAFLQSLLGMAQFFAKKSVGLRFLGESALGLKIGGSSTFWAGTEKYLRAYGTTSHPNILAAFLFLALVILAYLFFRQTDKKNIKEIILYEIALSVSTFGFLLTFSRTALFWGFLILFLAGVWAACKFRTFGAKIFLPSFLVFIFLSVLIIWQPFFIRASISTSEDAFTQRVIYMETASKMIKDKPLLGSGVGSFTLGMQKPLQDLVGSKNVEPWIYQPVHNIYLLAFSEIGALGFLAFLGLIFFVFWNLRKNLKDFSNPYLVILIGFLFFGLTDHYFWSLQTGRLMFWIILGLCLRFSLQNYLEDKDDNARAVS
jgi:putative inorganic carbon (HCO3(-)) transporter